MAVMPSCRVYCTAAPVKKWSPISIPNSDQLKKKPLLFSPVARDCCVCDEKYRFFHAASVFTAKVNPVNIPTENPAIGVMMYEIISPPRNVFPPSNVRVCPAS